MPKNFKSEGVDLLRTASIKSRAESYINAFKIYRLSPFFGTGFDSYRYAQQKQGMLDQRNWQTTHSASGVPNSFIFIFVTTGVFGFKDSTRSPILTFFQILSFSQITSLPQRQSFYCWKSPKILFYCFLRVCPQFLCGVLGNCRVF